MTQILSKLRIAADRLPRKRGFLRREDGAVTIPALLWIVFFIMFMFSGIEFGVVLIKQTLLDRATEATARIIRLAQHPNVTEGTLRASICDQAGFFGDSCFQRISVETFVVDQSNWTSSIDTHPLRCEDFSDMTKPHPSATLEGVLPNQIVLMRVCLREKPMMLFGSINIGETSLNEFIAAALLGASPVGDDGEYALVSNTAFVIEPSAANSSSGTGSGT